MICKWQNRFDILDIKWLTFVVNYTILHKFHFPSTPIWITEPYVLLNKTRKFLAKTRYRQFKNLNQELSTRLLWDNNYRSFHFGKILEEKFKAQFCDM